MSEEQKTVTMTEAEAAELRAAKAEKERLEQAAEEERYIREEARKIVASAQEGAETRKVALAERIRAEVQRLMPIEVMSILPDVRMNPRLEFGVAQREGNLSRADKQFLDILLRRKAMDSVTAGYGLEWVPTEFSTELADIVRINTKALAAFVNVQMPTDTYKIPKITADPTFYFNNVEALSQVAVSNPTTGNIELDAKKIMANIEWSGELDEDSVIPILPRLKISLGMGMAEAAENVVLNGDTTSTQGDNLNYSASDVDVHRALDGIRKHLDTDDATNASLYTDGSGGLFTAMRVGRKAMGKYGVDPTKLIIIPDTRAYMGMLADTNFLTMDKIGVKATVLTGQIGAADGSPVIPSGQIPATAATGEVDATSNTYGSLLVVYTPHAYVGWRRQYKLETDRDVQKDKNILVASFRIAFDMASVATATQGPISGTFKL